MKKPYLPNAHFWLLIPFAITITGFYWSYWSQFTEVPFRHHAHGITATAWYVLLIIQPWLYNNKPISYHRKTGFAGLMLAGGVIFSALQVIPYNIVSDFPPVLKYGLSFYDFGALLGFGTSVIMAMLQSKEINKHSRWMISTVFWALQPAFVRLVFIPLNMATNGNTPISFIDTMFICVAITTAPLILMMYFDYRYEKKIYVPYLLCLSGVPLLTVLVSIMGETQWWANWCENVLARGIVR